MQKCKWILVWFHQVRSSVLVVAKPNSWAATGRAAPQGLFLTQNLISEQRLLVTDRITLHESPGFYFVFTLLHLVLPFPNKLWFCWRRQFYHITSVNEHLVACGLYRKWLHTVGSGLYSFNLLRCYIVQPDWVGFIHQRDYLTRNINLLR